MIEYQSDFNFCMDQFLNNKEQFSIMKLEFTIQEWLLYLINSIKTERKLTNTCLKSLEKNIVQYKNQEYLISTEKPIPIGYYQMITLFKIKNNALEHYQTLIYSLKKIIMNFERKPKTKLFILQILLHMMAQTYDRDMNDFKQVALQYAESMKKGQIPLAEFKANIYEFYDFVVQILEDYDFNFKSDQKELLKRSSRN